MLDEHENLSASCTCMLFKEGGVAVSKEADPWVDSMSERLLVGPSAISMAGGPAGTRWAYTQDSGSLSSCFGETAQRRRIGDV